MAKTLIAIPCMDTVAYEFASSLATFEKVGEMQISMMACSLVYDARNKLAQIACTQGVDYVVWLDSDMVFAPDTVKKLLKHLEDGKDFVTGIYFMRRPPYKPVLHDENGKALSDYPENSVFEIEACGFGCVAMKTDLLLHMALDEKNWFSPILGFGEDLSFCKRARKLGYKLWCDSSIKLGHCSHTIITENIWKGIQNAKQSEADIESHD